jgi:thiol-disulfide isomerase/thioredoxin
VKRLFSHLIDIALYGAIAFALYSFVSRKLSGPNRGVEAAAFDLPVVGADSSARFRLAEHRGKPVLIEVFASWCPACRSSAPAVVEAFKKHGAQGATFVGVSMDSTEADALRVKRDWGIPYDVVRDDGRLSRDYKIEALPTFVVVGADGKVRHVSTGAASGREIERWLTEL